jgi:hypothetical protein
MKLAWIALLIFVNPHLFSADVLMDSALRYWNVRTNGVAGDWGSESSISDSSDEVFSLTFRMDFGRSIAELVYSKFNISAPFTIGKSFRGFAPAGQARSRFELQTLDFNFRNLIMEDEYISLRWIYGLSLLDIENTVHDVTGNRASMNTDGVVPVLGLEGEWFWLKNFSIRSHYRYGDFNVMSDEIRLKDFEIGMIYMPYDAFNFEVGFRNYSLDVIEKAANRMTRVGLDIKGPYSQFNWLF